MPETGQIETGQQQGPPQGTPPGAPAAPAQPEVQPEQGKGGKDAILADLAKERDKRQALEKQVGEMATAQQAQMDAFAKALGLKPEETSDGDQLATQLTALQEQFAATQRRAQLLELAAEHGITDKDDLAMLTATDPEVLRKQAEWVAAKNKAAAPDTPAFQPNPGQGQGGGTATLADQIAAAETAGDRAKVAELKAAQLLDMRVK